MASNEIIVPPTPSQDHHHHNHDAIKTSSSDDDDDQPKNKPSSVALMGISNVHDDKEEGDEGSNTYYKTTTTTTEKHLSMNKYYVPLLVVNAGFLFVGSVSSSMLTKYYFIHKGSSRWVSTWVQSAGFPVLFLPVYLPYLLSFTQRRPFSTGFDRKILTISIGMGLLIGISNLFISWGTSYLPVSTCSLLLSTQLVFNLIFSALIVKQAITFSNLNCVALLTLSSVLLAVGSTSDRPPGLTKPQYFVGFFCTLGAGLLFAVYLPIMEKVYKRSVHCYGLVVEMQLIMEVAATVLATVGMASDGGFPEMKTEGQRVFDKGPTVYVVTLVSTVVMWQLSFLGTAGMIFLTSSLTGGICMTALLGMNVLGGAIFFKDSFGGAKVVATLLSAWGFCSYVYGLYVNDKEEKKKEKQLKSFDLPPNQQMEMARPLTNVHV